MLEICLAFGKSEPQYAYKRYAYKKNMCGIFSSVKRWDVQNTLIEYM